MLTVKTNHYTIVQLEALSKILGEGLSNVMQNHCGTSCIDCKYSYVCNDVESTLKWLEKKIAESRNRLMINKN